MKKYFIVGRDCLLLGREIRSDVVRFSIGKTLSDQEKFVSVEKVENSIYVRKIFSKEVKYISEGVNLVFKALDKSFIRNCTFFVERDIYDLSLSELKQSKDKKTINKYKILTDVYNDPLAVPWNFVPAEIEEILSCFEKDLLKDKKILYIGAGYGKNIWAIKDRKYNIDSIEFSKKAVDRANKIFKRKAIFQQDLLSFKGYDNKKYDIVLDIGCIHCISGRNQDKAVDIVHGLMKENGILISRIFKPRQKEWLNRMPFETKSFGLTGKEIKELLWGKFSIENRHEHNDYVIIKAKKC